MQLSLWKTVNECDVAWYEQKARAGYSGRKSRGYNLANPDDIMPYLEQQ